MGLVGSRFYLLGGSLGLLGHALLDVVHGEGDGLRRGRGEWGRRFASTREDSVAVKLWVRSELKKYSNGRRADRRARVIGCQRGLKHVSWRTINK